MLLVGWLQGGGGKDAFLSLLNSGVLESLWVHCKHSGSGMCKVYFAHARAPEILSHIVMIQIFSLEVDIYWWDARALETLLALCSL